MNAKKHIVNAESGYSLVELILAVFVGSIVLGGGYASYIAVAISFDKSMAISEIKNNAIPAIKIIEKDLRMAGNKEVDTNMESTYGRIDDPTSVIDATLCCDELNIIYDIAIDNRIRHRYYVGTRSNPTRNTLFLDIAKWDGSAWVSQSTGSIVADYVDDFQVEQDSFNSNGDATNVSFGLVMKSKIKLKNAQTFAKTSFSVGNSNWSITDYYAHEEFSSNVTLRNLVD